MCIICVDYQKQLITSAEALRNMGEMDISRDHRAEIGALLAEGERLKEDRELVEAITKAPARYTFKVDVGSVPPEKAAAFLREAKKRLRGATRNPLDE